jgi:hypothetical protein
MSQLRPGFGNQQIIVPGLWADLVAWGGLAYAEALLPHAVRVRQVIYGKDPGQALTVRHGPPGAPIPCLLGGAQPIDVTSWQQNRSRGTFSVWFLRNPLLISDDMLVPQNVDPIDDKENQLIVYSVKPELVSGVIWTVQVKQSQHVEAFTDA